MSLSLVSPREQTAQTQFRFDTPAQANVEQSNNVSSMLKKIGFNVNTKIADSLQGSIHRAPSVNINNYESAVIKITNRYLHNHSLAMVAGKMYPCNENIIVESNILKYLTQQSNCPPSIVKFLSFTETETDYLFVMEDGGTSLFDFIQKAHTLIKNGKIEINHWRDVCKIIFKQMLECISYIHSQNIIHFDISLQNFLINDINVKVTQSNNAKNGCLEFELDDIQIKLCDFGLARVFMSSDTKSNNFVGKSSYKSPEICNKQEFDAKANDIWCLGICLYSMITGSVPFKKAVETDDAFKFIMKYKKMRQLLNAWNILHYMDDDIYDLIARFLQYEQSRIDLDGINKHSWLN